jgi:F-type H+-transporting ATPase subunit b
MKAHVGRKILLLAAAWFCVGAAGAVFAESGADHVQEQTHQAAAGHETAHTDHGSGEAAHGEGHGAGHAAPMITGEKLKDLLWRTLNFAALVFILVKFGGKPVVDALSSRRRTIEEDLSSLQAKRDEAERAYKEFEIKLEGMELEMEQIVQRAVALAKEERHRILAEAEAEARNIRRQAEAAVEAAAAAARHSLQDEVAEQAAAMAEQLIIKNLTAKDQVAIIEQYLARAVQ